MESSQKNSNSATPENEAYRKTAEILVNAYTALLQHRPEMFTSVRRFATSDFTATGIVDGLILERMTHLHEFAFNPKAHENDIQQWGPVGLPKDFENYAANVPDELREELSQITGSNPSQPAASAPPPAPPSGGGQPTGQSSAGGSATQKPAQRPPGGRERPAEMTSAQSSQPKK